MTRKVTYIIDDLEYFRREWSKPATGLTSKKVDELIHSMSNSFKAVYTLIEDDAGLRYELTVDGKNTNVNDLNGYQRGLIIAECHNHFDKIPILHNDIAIEQPTGVIEIIESWEE